MSETEGEEKKDEEDEDEGGPVSRQGFNDEPLKFAVIEWHQCPVQ